MSWADGKGSLSGIANQGEATANRPIHALQIVEIRTAGGVAQVTIGVATNFDIAAHHAEQDRAIVRQHGIVVHRVANRPTGKLVGDQIFTYQFLVQRFRDLIFNHQRVPGAQAIARDKRIIDFGFDIHQRLVDTDHP